MTMKLEEKTLSNRRVFEGKLLKVNCDEVELPDGRKATREYVHHNGGAAIIAEIDGKICFVEQFRYPYHCAVLELPAGKRDGDETFESTAKRELNEETGLLSDKIISLGKMYPSPGYTDEVIGLFYAENCTRSEQHFDDDEFLNLKFYTREETKRMIFDGRLTDAKSIIALLKYFEIKK